MMMIQYILIASILMIFVQALDQFQQFKERMAIKVDLLANKSRDQFGKFDEKCLVPSFDQCEGAAQLKCFQHFPSAQGCVGQGSMLSIKSAIKIPPQSVKNQLTNQQKHIICKTAQLESFFQSLHLDNKGQFLTSYIGTSTGMYRAYPTIKYDESKNLQQFNCRNYDPRFRSWYTSAISGKKNIVFIMDNSNALRGHLQTMKIAAQNFIKTLSGDDIILALNIQQSIKQLTPQKQFMNIDQEVKTKVEQNIKNIKQNKGSANFSQIFKLSYKKLNDARKNIHLCCLDGDKKNNVVFVMFTDQLTDLDIQNIQEQVSANNDKFKSQIFTYIFNTTSQQNSDTMARFSCRNYGEYYIVNANQSPRNLKTKIHQIYKVMAQGQNFTKPRWSQFYIDAFGFGEMVSITQPIYYRNGQIEYLVGVASIDVHIQQWLILESNKTEIQRRLKNLNQYKIIKQGSNCENTTQIIRPILQFKEIKGQIFQQPITTQTSQCCGLVIGALVGIVVGICIFLIALVVGICAYFYIKNKKMKKQLEQENKQKNLDENKQQTQRYMRQTIIIDQNSRIFPSPPPGLLND